MYKNLWREKKVHKFLYFLFAKKLFSYFFYPKKVCDKRNRRDF